MAGIHVCLYELYEAYIMVTECWEQPQLSLIPRSVHVKLCCQSLKPTQSTLLSTQSNQTGGFKVTVHLK